MEIKVEIPQYDKNSGLSTNWEYGFEINVKESNDGLVILANKAGLISLAIQLLTLAQEGVLQGSHFHYDDSNSLEYGSRELVIQKK